MTHPALAEVECPICLDTLKKPIRILRCGHNLCQSCLLDLCNVANQRRCPSCRQNIQLGTNGVEDLPRNHVIENIIEKLRYDVGQEIVSSSIKPQPLDELKGLANSLVNQGKYKEASEVLTRLINQNEGICKIPLLIKQLKCLQMLDQIEEAKQVFVELASILDASNNVVDIKDQCCGCDEELEELVEKYLEVEECSIVIGLTNSMFKLIMCLRESEDKLYKLKDVDEVQCPICLDTLKKPIRMLSCGHNLCQICLVDLYKNVRQRSCPTCRQAIELGGNGVEDLPRNHVVENMIEKLDVGVKQIKASFKIEPQSQSELKSLAESLIKEGNHQIASDILTTLIVQNRAIGKIPFMVMQLKCLEVLDRIQRAKQVCLRLALILNSCDDIEMVNQKCAGCDEELKDVAEKLLEKKECDGAIGLAISMFKLIKCSQREKEKLTKFQKLGGLLQNIAIEMSKQNRVAEFKSQLQPMNEILKEMQNVNNVDVKTKCLEVTWYMKYFGSSCIYMKEYSRCIEITNHAIYGMLLVFGDESCKYRLLGVCYNNIGWAYENNNRLVDAKASYTKAIVVCSSATDYPSDEAKKKTILLYTKNLNRTIQKMQKK